MGIRTFLGAFFFLLTISCNQSSDSAANPARVQLGEWSNGKLRFIGEATFPAGQKILGPHLGGLSSLHFHRPLGQLLAASDDPGKWDPTRIYFFFPRLTSNSFKLIPSQVFYLKESEKKDALYLQADLEGLSAHPNGNLFVSTEGRSEGDKKTPPQILRLNANAQLLERLPVPQKFLPSSSKGTPSNRGFEGLSLSEDGKKLYVMAQDTLLQDALKGVSRLLVYESKEEKYDLVHEYLYQRDKVEESHLNVSEIRWAGEDQLLVVERSAQTIRLFKAQVAGSDVKKIDQLGPGSYTMMDKKIILDFAQFPAQLLGAPLGNIEGLTWGPQLDNGHATLILVNDNDFSALPTNFLAFEVLTEL